jgi:hypothetical protein
MRWGTTIVDRPRSYPDGHLAEWVDDVDTHLLYGAARELEAHLAHGQARHLADVRSLLAELYQRDGVPVDDAVLDAQAEDVARQERGERFLQELGIWLHPSAELLELAGQLDDHALAVWREVAAGLADECPPCLLQLRWRVEEEQRGKLRGHAHLVRTEAHLGAQLRRSSLIVRLWRYRQVAELRDRLVHCRRLRERSQRRLAFMDAKLQVIQRAEQARAVWLTQAREVLVRGLVAAEILTEREQQRDDDQQKIGGPSGPAALEARVRLGVVS